MDDELFLRELWQPSAQDSYLYNWDEQKAKARKEVMRNLVEMMASSPCPKNFENSSNLFKILVKKLRGQISSYDSNPQIVDVATKKVAKWVENVVKEAYYKRQGRIKPRIRESEEIKKEEIRYEPIVEEPEDEIEGQFEPKMERLSIRTVGTEPERASIRSTKLEPEIKSIRSTRTEPERASIRSTKLEPEIESIRSTRTEPERASIRSTKLEPEIESIRSTRTELERASIGTTRLEQEKGAIELPGTEPEKKTIKLGTYSQKSTPKSVIIDGVEYVVKEEKEEQKKEEEAKWLNVEQKIHKKPTKPVIRELTREKVTGEKLYATQYAVSESSDLPSSRVVVDRDQHVVLVKAKRNAHVRNAGEQSSEPPKIEKKKYQKNNISEEASVRTSLIDSSIDEDKSAAPLIRNWSSWMINLTKKARSLMRWDASEIDHTSRNNIAKVDNYNNDKYNDFMEKQIKSIAEKPKEYLQRSLEQDDLNSIKNESDSEALLTASSNFN